jgi:hypothetical protein
MAALEEQRAQMFFEQGHLSADRAMRDRELIRSERKTLVPRRALEGAEGFQRWQGDFHGLPV